MNPSSKKIKVLVISDYRDFHSVRPEAEVFISLAKKGFQIHLMTYGEAGYVERFREAGIEVTDFHPETKFSSREIAVIREELLKGRYDILQLFNSKAIINGIQAAKDLPVKIVLYRGYSGNIHWWDPTAYLKFLHPSVDKIWCNSIGVKEMFDRQWFFDRQKAVTINKGHKLEWYQQTEPADLAQLGIPKDAFVVVNVCNNRRMKGIPYLLKAFHYLPKNLPIHLLLVGRDFDTPQNKKLIEHSGYAEQIHLLGFRKDALEIVAASDVFALSSIKGESITKSVIEAMSLGVAPVITDIAGNVELVEDGQSGLVVPAKNSKKMAEALLRLYQSKELLQQIKQNAPRHIASSLNADQTVEQVARLYQTLAD